MAEETVYKKVKELGTREAIAGDPRFAGIVGNVLPLTGNLGNTRTRIRTLGRGSFGRVNLEEVNSGQIAAKYFTDPTNFEDNVAEIAALKCLQGMPYVAQLIGTNIRPAGIPVNIIAPRPNVPTLNFPVALMGKAVSDLHRLSVIRSWDDIERVVIQVLKGVAVMHSQGIVHRDIKPGNILMTAAKEVWISDFGKAKYLDTNIPKTREVYTGTYVTSAPELLMKDILSQESPTNYFKSDLWATGVTLYYIMTGTYLFSGSPVEIIDQMFIRAGFPSATDGVTYTLFQDMDFHNRLRLSMPRASYTPSPTAYKDRILTRTRFPPPDPARLEPFATVINELMSFDPADRPSAIEALNTITGEDYVVPPRRSLISQYINTTPLPAAVAADYEVDCYKTLELIMDHLFVKNEIPYTIDRALIYSRALLLKNTTLSRALVFNVALAIADTLLDTTGGNTVFGPEELAEIITPSHPIPASITKDIINGINTYMTSDIQFFGRTFFDDLVDSTPELPTVLKNTKIQMLGLLNFFCHQYSIFSMYEGHLDLLKQKIIEYVQSGQIKPRDYFYTRIDIGSGRHRHPIKRIVTDFLTFIRASDPRAASSASGAASSSSSSSSSFAAASSSAPPGTGAAGSGAVPSFWMDPFSAPPGTGAAGSGAVIGGKRKTRRKVKKSKRKTRYHK